jgi:hypothetical protein
MTALGALEGCLRWRLGCVDHELDGAVVTFATAAVGRPVAPRVRGRRTALPLRWVP